MANYLARWAYGRALRNSKFSAKISNWILQGDDYGIFIGRWQLSKNLLASAGAKHTHGRQLMIRDRRFERRRKMFSTVSSFAQVTNVSGGEKRAWQIRINFRIGHDKHFSVSRGIIPRLIFSHFTLIKTVDSDDVSWKQSKYATPSAREMIYVQSSLGFVIIASHYWRNAFCSIKVFSGRTRQRKSLSDIRVSAWRAVCVSELSTLISKTLT